MSPRYDMGSPSNVDEVASVYATVTSSSQQLVDANVHDNATVMIKFQRGAIATFSITRSTSYGYDQRCEFFGEHGLAVVGNEHLHSSILSNRDGIHAAPLQFSFPQQYMLHRCKNGMAHHRT